MLSVFVWWFPFFSWFLCRHTWEHRILLVEHVFSRMVASLNLHDHGTHQVNLFMEFRGLMQPVVWPGSFRNVF